ncbi:capsular exopolysaccharide family [Anaeromyxobacter dehalogenans 2CP-1]|uniref:Capsular exopolysaccharide family n=1 Tax=Anaeromyxobacter dehalogenans (strain ATCC BAA-258 / DSM 21875 / 2CP-1) TaxID=455488 RepID=B8JEA2_ANAD2|nr:CpsD/CapB family tyrosine-protein kinase [Anaeromyxobacter dehalogenans]ACL66167.1 capsular exopolysaccharide family [Anaeromyxobacter dehalogenans 2CP-1]
MIPAETLNAAFPTLAPESRLVALDAPASAAAEQYRVLYQRLLRLAARRPMRVLAITSAGRGEGRTTTAANLALTAAQEGRATVLVEADLRRPVLAARFGLAPRAGLAEVLEGAAELAQAVVRVGPLAVLCAGDPRDPAQALRSPRAVAIMEQLRAAYEHVILDAPPALAGADGDRLVQAADAALLVVRSGATPRQVVRLALDALGERAAGVVLNAVDAGAVAHGRWIYGDASAVAPPPVPVPEVRRAEPL